MKIPIITTDRLTLRGWTNSDAEALFSLNSDPVFVKYLGNGQTLSREDSWRVMAMLTGHWALKGFGLWAIELNDTNEVIGRAGLWEPEGWPATELGWGLSPKHWGKGYASEAASACLHWAFEELKLDSVISIIHPENTASKKLATQLGEKYSHSRVINGVNLDIYKMTNPTQE